MICFIVEFLGVIVEGSSEEAFAAPPDTHTKASATKDGDDGDDDVDLFGEEIEEEKKAAEERAATVKAFGKKKKSEFAVCAKSSVVMDVKTMDDDTYMKRLEEAVRGVQMEGYS